LMKDSSRDLFGKMDDFLTEKLKGYDELKNVVTQGLPAHLANDLSKLKKERDKVLQRLGEQTFQLLSQGKLIVPGIVQATYRTAQEIVERITRIEMDTEVTVPEPAAEAAKEKAVDKVPVLKPVSKPAPKPMPKAAPKNVPKARPAAKSKKPAPKKPAAKKPAPKKAAKKPAKKAAPKKTAKKKAAKAKKGTKPKR